MSYPFIKTNNLSKTYLNSEVPVKALNQVNLEIPQEDYVAIIGASGSGKSTFLNLLGCLDLPTSGEYFLDNVLINKLSKSKLADIRNEKIGFVFQNFNLLARTSALDNVTLPLLYNRKDKNLKTKELGLEVLKKVGLEDRTHHLPNQLSGGQQQRVAIARALVNQPSIILADEPTGNLDSKTTEEIIALFRELNQQGITIIIVTHELDVAEKTNRIVEFKDGFLIRDEKIV